MARRKKTLDSVPETNGNGDTTLKSLILRLPPQEHSWVKKVAEATEQTQPKVINYILSQIAKAPVDDYIEEIGRNRKAEQRDELLKQQQMLKEKLEKLDEELS